uniref:Transposase Tc1-like domain-containing protein n=1 Tax=Pygocentrus nattereri TaxID=42514 RepID=A0AAR2K665_PYGNA
MKQLTEFERGLIVGARMAGASVTRTAELLNVSRGTVSKVLTAFAKYGQTASAKRNCGRKAKLSDSERRALIRIVAEKHRNQTTKKTTTFDITTELNQNRCDPVSTRTVRRELGKVLEVLKHGMCGDIGNIPIHKAQALEKQGEEEEEEEEDDEEVKPSGQEPTLVVVRCPAEFSLNLYLISCPAPSFTTYTADPANQGLGGG